MIDSFLVVMWFICMALTIVGATIKIFEKDSEKHSVGFYLYLYFLLLFPVYIMIKNCF